MNLAELLPLETPEHDVRFTEGTDYSFFDECAPKEAVYWYRYEDTPGDDWRGPEVRMRKLRVLKETPAGVWLDDWGVKRFVLKEARKRFAYPTIELARGSFLIRKRHQVAHLQRQLEHAQTVLAAAEEHFK